MTDHDAIAARVRQGRETGTPGPWKRGKNNPARVSREGRYIADFDPLHSKAQICENDAARAAFLPDLEEAYLDLYDEAKRLRSERDDWMSARNDAVRERVAAEAERDRLRTALIDHNDLLRSAMQICSRAIQHEEFRVLANWDAFHNRISVCLKRHHATSNDARAALKGDIDE